MACDKEKNKKTAANNQWAGSTAVGKSNDYQEKTEFSNEWISTNKMVTAANAVVTEEI